MSARRANKGYKGYVDIPKTASEASDKIPQHGPILNEK